MLCKTYCLIKRTAVKLWFALDQRGIKYQFSLSERLENGKEFTVHILQEHDHLIISNENEIVTLVPGEVKECGVAPNQLKNSITIGMK